MRTVDHEGVDVALAIPVMPFRHMRIVCSQISVTGVAPPRCAPLPDL
jgi:hypothetical protein